MKFHRRGDVILWLVIRPRPLLWLMERLLRAHGALWRSHDVGRAGEDAAYFFLQRNGFQVVAQDWHDEIVPGDLDLVAWEGETLCFIEVKSRSSRGVFAAELSVTQAKQESLHRMSDAYVRSLPWRGGKRRPIVMRFDVVSVYFDGEDGAANVQMLRGAFQ